MNIEEINKKHFLETGMYYRVGFGLHSKLVDYKNGIIFLEVIIGRKWRKSHNATAHELAHCWKETHPELEKAVAAKVYIIDTKKYSYKRALIHSGVKPSYDAKKGVLYREQYMN